MATNPFAALQEEESKPARDAKLCSSCGKTKSNEVCLPWCSSCGKTKSNEACLPGRPRAWPTGIPVGHAPEARGFGGMHARVERATVRSTVRDARVIRVGLQAFSKKQWAASAHLRKCALCTASAAASGGGVSAHSADGRPAAAPQGAPKDAAGAEPAAPASALSPSMCWICYDDDPALGGLVAPCKCSGTVAYGKHYVVVLRLLLSVQGTVLCSGRLVN